MSLPQGKKTNRNRLPNLLMYVTIAFALVLVVIQFQVSSSFEMLAKRVGIFDSQSKTVNVVYLDYEEQSAIMRSSTFLVAEKGQGYVTSPSRVIYLEPFVNDSKIVSQKNDK